MIQLSLYQKLALISFILSIELILFLLCIFIFNWIITLIIEAIIHYLLLFKLIHDTFFSGGVKSISRYHCWKLGVYIYAILTLLHNSKIAESFQIQLKELTVLINECFYSNKTIFSTDDLIGKSSSKKP